MTHAIGAQQEGIGLRRRAGEVGVPENANELVRGLANTPMKLSTVDDPGLLGPDWVVVESRLTGTCRADRKYKSGFVTTSEYGCHDKSPWAPVGAVRRGIYFNDLADLNRIIGEDDAEPCDLGRAGLPEEAGAVIAFLASRSNSYTIGANVNVDGGSDFT